MMVGLPLDRLVHQNHDGTPTHPFAPHTLCDAENYKALPILCKKPQGCGFLHEGITGVGTQGSTNVLLSN